MNKSQLLGTAENTDNNCDSMKGKQNKRLTSTLVGVLGDTAKRDPRGIARTTRKKKRIRKHQHAYYKQKGHQKNGSTNEKGEEVCSILHLGKKL